MGHEYVELKMTEAAIEAYRQVCIIIIYNLYLSVFHSRLNNDNNNRR